MLNSTLRVGLCRGFEQLRVASNESFHLLVLDFFLHVLQVILILLLFHRDGGGLFADGGSCNFGLALRHRGNAFFHE